MASLISRDAAAAPFAHTQNNTTTWWHRHKSHLPKTTKRPQNTPACHDGKLTACQLADAGHQSPLTDPTYTNSCEMLRRRGSRVDSRQLSIHHAKYNKLPQSVLANGVYPKASYLVVVVIQSAPLPLFASQFLPLR
jgi:hypothetical protein